VLVLAGLAVRHTSSAGALPPGAPALLPGSTVIGVEAAHPADRRMGDLPLVAAQDELLTGTYGPRWRRIADATADQVLAELPTADVCQFLCHSDADPIRTYDKGVVLTDRTLRVSEILAHAPRRQRLVILGDLSRTPGAGRPDEPAGFPDAMLQLGAQGVVAPSWSASETAAALVLQRFHEEMAAGTEPVNALADAQRWLRSATGGEISRDFPGLYHDEPEDDPSARPFAAHAEWAAFTYTGI
jgi:CHAT domain-containing protein